MQQDNNQKAKRTANRILYITIIGVLCICATVAGIAASMSSQEETPSSSLPVNQTVTPNKDENKLPTFVPPVSGTLTKAHDLSTPVYSMTMQEYRVHRGVDISTEEGAPVYAVANGIVEDICKDPMMGWCVTISHSGNAESTYANLSPEVADHLTVGQTVVSGQVIGAVGSSALLELADEPHLHFEMYVSGNPVDPTEYITIATSNTTENEKYEG